MIVQMCIMGVAEMNKILAIDPSGNFSEGSGTTGLCLTHIDENKEMTIMNMEVIKAKDYGGMLEYHQAIIQYIAWAKPDCVVMEGYRLYNFGSNKAETQSYSALETPQLIGAIKNFCYTKEIPCYEQMAHEVKSRWSDSVLIDTGIMEVIGKTKCINGIATNDHMRDAYRHAIHFIRYKLPKLKGES